MRIHGKLARMNTAALRSFATTKNRVQESLANNAAGYRVEMRRFARAFTPRTVKSLTRDQFREFLASGRWSNLPRLQRWLTGERWISVRNRIAVLVDDGIPIERRLEQARPEQHTERIPYLGKAVITGVLHTAWPDRFGVWNGTSAQGLRALGVRPRVPRGATFATQYLAFNDELKRIASELDLDLVELDLLWYQWHTGRRVKGSFWNIDDTLLSDGELFEEGTRATREHKVLERSAALVRLAKDQWTACGTRPPACEVCGWTMADIYGGDVADLFIEAHHRDMLGQAQTPVRHGVDALAPVCPNCHRMLHKSQLSIDELRNIVTRRGSAKSLRK